MSLELRRPSPYQTLRRRLADAPTARPSGVDVDRPGRIEAAGPGLRMMPNVLSIPPIISVTRVFCPAVRLEVPLPFQTGPFPTRPQLNLLPACPWSRMFLRPVPFVPPRDLNSGNRL